MKTINKNLKVTNKELAELTEMFEEGITLVRKVILYGAGHPQLPNLFWLRGDEENKIEFLKEHETTHAKFIKYNSIIDMSKDEHFWRSDLISTGIEFNKWDCLIYNL